MTPNTHTRPVGRSNEHNGTLPLGDNVRWIADDARERLAEVGEAINSLVTSRPALALAAALAAGVIVGWLIKRR
jgi:hypothetical protein